MLFQAAKITSFLNKISDQTLIFVYSKKDLIKNDEERNKVLGKIYGDGLIKEEIDVLNWSNMHVKHGISNSQSMIKNHDENSQLEKHHLATNHVISTNLSNHKNLNSTAKSHFELKTNEELVAQNVVAHNDHNLNNYLQYRLLPAGTNCVGKDDPEFKKKKNYQFCDYMTSEEIHQRYNSKPFVTLEKQMKIFKYTEDGELLLVDEEILNSQRGVITDVIKQATLNLVKGKGLMRVQMPIRLFEPICSYELIARFTGCMDKIYEAANVPPGIERLKHVISWLVGGYIQTAAVKKPFNNIIGETINGQYIDGTQIYGEHVNHDPPIELILVVNERLKFRMSASYETVVGLGPNEVSILLKGITTIEIGEDKIFIQLAPIVNRGLLFGKLRVCATEAFYVYYPNSQLKGLIKVGNKTCQDVLSGGIYWSNPNIVLNTNTFKQSLFSSIKEKSLIKEKCVSTVSGRLFDSISFDDKEYWNKNYRYFGLMISDKPLPSDWIYRDDILWLWRNNSELSMKWKIQLEDVNRADRKAREAFRKKNKHLFV